MIAVCHPIPHQIAEEMLQVVARAICDRPGETPAQRDSRTSQLVHSITGLTPRDGLEYMLSSLAVGHFNLILDSMREVFEGQTEAMKVRTKSTIVALDRAFIGMVRELRIERKRPLAKWTEAAQPSATVEKTVKAPEANIAALAPGQAAEWEIPATGPAPTSGRDPDMADAARHPTPAGAEFSGKAEEYPSDAIGYSGVGEVTPEQQLAYFERTMAMVAAMEGAQAPEHTNGKAKAASEE